MYGARARLEDLRILVKEIIQDILVHSAGHRLDACPGQFDLGEPLPT